MKDIPNSIDLYGSYSNRKGNKTQDKGKNSKKTEVINLDEEYQN